MGAANKKFKPDVRLELEQFLKSKKIAYHSTDECIVITVNITGDVTKIIVRPSRTLHNYKIDIHELGYHSINDKNTKLCDLLK